MQLRSLTFLLSIVASNSINFHLIKDLQTLKNVRTLLVITCENTSHPITDTTKNLQSDDTWINVLDISNRTPISEVNFQRFFIRLSCNLMVICSLMCYQSNAFLIEISKLKMFHGERSWLMFSDSLEYSVSVLNGHNVNSDAEITLALHGKQNGYQLYDVYNPSFDRHGNLNVTEVGHWTNTRLEMYSTKSKFEERRNFGALKFHAVVTIPKRTTNNTLFDYLDSLDNVQTDSIDRFNYHLFKMIREMFNFQLFLRRSNIWGVKLPNGTWHGSIGMLNRSEVDIMVSGVRWDDERYGAFDQTTSTYFFKVVFIFRHPKNVDTLKVFVSPFVPTVWLLVAVLALIIVLGLHCAFTVEIRNKPREELDANGNVDRSQSNCILIVFGYLFQQGYSGNPLLISSRFFVTSILIFSLMLYQYYGSFIVGSLLTESPKTITTVKNLLESNIYIYMDEVPYILDNFKRVKEKSAVQLFHKVMAQNPIFLPVSNGVTMIRLGHAFHTDASYAYLLLKSALTDHEICDLQEIEYQEKLQCGPGVPVKSHLREWIKLSLRKIQETGLMAYHWKIWMGRKPKCEIDDLEVIPVDMMHFSSAVYALAIGIQLSVAFLIGEVFMRRKFT